MPQTGMMSPARWTAAKPDPLTCFRDGCRDPGDICAAHLEEMRGWSREDAARPAVHAPVEAPPPAALVWLDQLDGELDETMVRPARRLSA